MRYAAAAAAAAASRLSSAFRRRADACRIPNLHTFAAAATPSIELKLWRVPSGGSSPRPPLPPPPPSLPRRRTVSTRTFPAAFPPGGPIAEARCPFETLGIPASSSCSEVRATFLKLALRHHPDTAAASSVGDGEEDEAAAGGRVGEERDAAAKFIELRRAFENIREAEDGSAVSLRFDASTRRPGGSGGSGPMSEEEFEAWFRTETGHDAVPYGHSSLRHVNPAVLRKTAEATEGMSPGGLDRGGHVAARREPAGCSQGGGPAPAEGGERLGGKDGQGRRRRWRR